MSETAPLVKEVLTTLLEGTDVSRDTAKQALGAILDGQVTPAQIGALLVAWRLKGETVEEITGFVEAMRGACVPFCASRSPLVDLCGTGGDGSGTINISTAASLIVAAALSESNAGGVAKHGNRSASSQCGSADVLEALGIAVEVPPDRGAACLDEHGFAFLFAPSYHPAMRYAGPPRRELGIRTFFNILGPLSSPAGVKRQLIGVFDDAVRSTMAQVLRELGSEHVWVVHSVLGDGRGLDELSIAGESRVTCLKGGAIEEFEVTPEDAGLERSSLDALRGGDASHNAERVAAILQGEKGPQRDAVLLNAGAALVIADAVADIREGVQRGSEVIDSGRARSFLEELKAWTV